MFSDWTIISIILIYVGVLFVLSLYVERNDGWGRRLSDSPLVYSLSLGIYCTTWTYYGSVGTASTSGLVFLGYYLGPVMSIVLWWTVLRKIVRIKQEYRITSIADFIAARYDNSHLLAALVTVISCASVAPYIALQFKAIQSTFNLIAFGRGGEFISGRFGLFLVALMALFTIAFGVRRLDPTERHRGMVAAVAIESVVKLVMFLIAGVFITYFAFHGFGDLFRRFHESGLDAKMAPVKMSGEYVNLWFTYMLLGFSSILFLPRQFHIAVIENTDEKHIRTAMWMLPLYMLLINIFVMPIAMAGLLKGFPHSMADTFVMRLPLHLGQPVIGLMVFVGGFSAAMSMTMIGSMTLATMISNHLVLPVAGSVRWLGFVRHNILKVRWLAVILVIAAGYWFELKIGGSYTLLNMGLIAFAACAQFAPAALGGIFWRRGNRHGALLGLVSGFAIWFYTLLLPSFMKSGMIPSAVLERGPWGVALLKPEQLFGVTGLQPITHTVFWSMVFNIGLYILGSIVFKQSEAGGSAADKFVGILDTENRKALSAAGGLRIDLSAKKRKIAGLLEMYFTAAKTEKIIAENLAELRLSDRKHITSVELSELCVHIEKVLAGSVGATVAHTAFRRARIFEEEEDRELKLLYGEILAGMRIPPAELRRRVDYYREREELITVHSNDLEEKVRLLQREIAERIVAEGARRESEARLQAIIDNAPAAIFIKDLEGNYTLVNTYLEWVYGKPKEQIIGRKSYDFMPAESAEEIRKNDLRVLETKAPVIVEEMIMLANGEMRIFSSVKFPMVSVDGEVYGICGITTDIMERKLVEKELELYRERLEALVEERTEELRKTQEQLIVSERMAVLGQFAGSIAHEVRNPLGVISNAVYYLKKAYAHADEKYDSYIKLIGLQIKRATEIIESILRLTQMKSAHLERSDICEVVRESFEAAEMPEGIEKKYRFPPGPVYAYMDREQMRIAFRNIIVNAVQAVGAAGTLTAYVREEERKGCMCVAVSISDTGGGIADKDKESIFNPLFSTKMYGIGFGLTIVKMIVEKHEGWINVDSVPGAGTTFEIVIPLKKFAEDGEQAARDILF